MRPTRDFNQPENGPSKTKRLPAYMNEAPVKFAWPLFAGAPAFLAVEMWLAAPRKPSFCL